MYITIYIIQYLCVYVLRSRSVFCSQHGQSQGYLPLCNFAAASLRDDRPNQTRYGALCENSEISIFLQRELRLAVTYSHIVASHQQLHVVACKFDRTSQLYPASNHRKIS